MALSEKQVAILIKNNKPYHWSKTYIKKIQTLLNKCGWKLVVDGILGPKTATAVYEFQLKYGLKKDGVPGTIETLPKLNAVISAKTPTASSNYMTDADWKANRYFDLFEFRCGCIKPGHTKYCDGYPVKVYKKLITALTKIRTHFNKPVVITSGLRCKKFNATLSHASSTSKHITGGAADFYVKGVDIKDVLAYCKKLKKAGDIKYYYTNSTNMNGAVHVNI